MVAAGRKSRRIRQSLKTSFFSLLRKSLWPRHRTAESRLLEKAREAEEYRRMLDQMGHNAGVLLRRADEDAFIRDMRESFQKDPVATTALMIKKFQEGIPARHGGEDRRVRSRSRGISGAFSTTS